MSFNGDLYPTAGADIVMTTKGDVVRYDSQRERLGVGSTNQVLAVTAGLPAWKTLTTADSVLTTQGDILYEGAAGLARLGQSTDGFVLTTKGASANPVWAAAAGGGQVSLIESYTATGAELTKTFTFSPALDLAADYSELIIVGNLYGTATLGVGGLQVNGATSTYNNSGGFSWNGASTVQVLDTTASSIVLFPSSTNVASTGVLFNCNLQFMKTGGGGVSCYACHTNTVSDGGIHAGRSSAIMDGTNTNSLADTLSSLTILTGGNWQTGTNITVYGVKRT